MATLLDHVRSHLIAQGLVRDPRVAGSLPPCWRQPANGTPAPGEGTNPTEIGADAVIGLVHSGGIASLRLESAWRQGHRRRLDPHRHMAAGRAALRAAA
jgi:hypothetical protein